jgi:hypothetical protein
MDNCQLRSYRPSSRRGRVEHDEVVISDTLPFERVQEALTLATTPGAADKVVVTF